MTVFEFVMVLVSIIIGLGIARMLDGVLRVLGLGRHTERTGCTPCGWR